MEDIFSSKFDSRDDHSGDLTLGYPDLSYRGVFATVMLNSLSPEDLAHVHARATHGPIGFMPNVLHLGEVVIRLDEVDPERRSPVAVEAALEELEDVDTHFDLLLRHRFIPIIGAKEIEGVSEDAYPMGWIEYRAYLDQPWIKNHADYLAYAADAIKEPTLYNTVIFTQATLAIINRYDEAETAPSDA